MTWNASLIDGPITIYTYGQPDEEGVRPVTGTVPGYHLNIAPEIMTNELEQFRIVPETPSQSFAGAETVFLKFTNEAQAKSNLAQYWSLPSD